MRRRPVLPFVADLEVAAVPVAAEHRALRVGPALARADERVGEARVAALGALVDGAIARPMAASRALSHSGPVRMRSANPGAKDSTTLK